MKVGVVGHLGVVGSATKHYAESKGHEVVGYDIQDEYTALVDLRDTDICFVCVPTPSNNDGSCDCSIVKEVVESLSKHTRYQGIIAVRSTVTPGTTYSLSEKNSNVVYIPEFLREHKALEDTQNQDVVVLGHTNAADKEKYNLVSSLFDGCEVHQMQPTNAEFLKYFHNTLNAMKVVFANSFYDIMGEDDSAYEQMINAWRKINRDPGHYLDVNKKLRGYGGPCLPKDTVAMAKYNEQLGIKENIFKYVDNINRKFPITVPEGMRQTNDYQNNNNV